MSAADKVTSTRSHLSDLPMRLKKGAIVLEIQSGSLKRRLLVTLDVWRLGVRLKPTPSY
jgi:hypothetical protein